MSFLASIISVILTVVNRLGYLGIFLGMVLESSFFPFPSEVILIPAGALISQGKMNSAGVFSLALIGSIVGASINYFLAFVFGRKGIEKLVSRYGKVFFISGAELEKTDRYFEHHGPITTFVGRLIPGIRQLISLPAGFSKMKLSGFFFFTALGAGLWSLFLIATGWLADRNQAWLSQNQTLAAVIIIAFCALLVAVYVAVSRKRKTKKN